MKVTLKRLTVFAAIILTLLTAVVCGLFLQNNSVSASAETRATQTHLSGYAITYDIAENRSISITEDITVYFYGNAGFLRDIPVNGGEKIYNLKVYELDGSLEKSVYYDVFSEDNSFLSVDIGDTKVKYNEERTYRIKYDYCLTSAPEGDELLALTPVGGGWSCDIENVSIKLILPDGYVGDSAKIFTQTPTVDRLQSFTPRAYEENGRTVIFADGINLDGKHNESLRVDLSFEKGALTTYFDFTPYWFVIAAAVILLIVVILKVTVYNKSRLSPVINFEAPDGMDPLLMGKLIDNIVNPEDITSMIFYWADKGYLKIDLTDQNNPALIRIVRKLPESAPAYEVTMFNEMFRREDVVRPSDLKNSFYRTIQRVTAMVNSRAKGLYDSKSIGLSVLLAVLCGILPGIAPMILAMTCVSSTYFMVAPFVSLVPMLVAFGLAETVKYNALKYKRGKKLGLCAGIAGIGLVLAAFYAILVPSFVIGVLPKILLCLVSFSTVVTSVLLIKRTDAYTQKLNGILGFKNFILYAEKDRLEKLLEDDPQFYYHILPYAQVLGVSDKWEEKFADITIEPPQWISSPIGTVFRLHMFNRILRHSTSSFRTNMVSRPSSSGISGGGRGGFGGFSGGGHGGGGGRFR